MHNLLFHQKFPQAFGSGHPQDLCFPVQKFQFNIRQPDSDKMRMVQFLFHSSFSHDFISFLLSVTSVTPQTGEPAVLPESSYCAASHFPVDANICQIGRSSRVWGCCRSGGPAFSTDRSGAETEIPGKSPTQEYTIVYYGVDLALGKSPSRAQPVSWGPPGMALPLNTGGSCPIISTPSLNVTGSGYYTGAKRNNFILFNQIRSYLFYSLKIPSLNPIVRDRNTRRFEKSFNFLLQKIFPLTYRKEIRKFYSA